MNDVLARSRATLVLLLAVCVACEEEKPLTDEERGERKLAEYMAKIASDDVDERADGAFGLTIRCCRVYGHSFSPGLDHTRSEACRALAEVLVSERDPRVLDRVGTSEPMCESRIPADILLDLIRRKPPERLRRALYYSWLARIAPSPEAVRVVIASADLDSVAKPLAETFMALASYGEEDLEPVVEMLAHPDRRARLFAAETIQRAAGRAPLELPQAVEGLERARQLRDDEELAERAEWALEAYEQYANTSPDEVVEQYLEDGEASYGEIRMLGVRRFSCKTELARQVLEHLAGRDFFDREPGTRQTAEAARNALAIRAKRCTQRGH